MLWLSHILDSTTDGWSSIFFSSVLLKRCSEVEFPHRVTYLGNLIQQDGSVHVELCLEWYCSGGDDQFLCMYLFIRVHIYCDFKADSDKAATPTQSSKNQPHFQ